MKVSEVGRLLEGLAQGLTELSKKTADGLAAVCTAIHPFGDQTVEQFTEFLRQCDEYRRTGTVAAGRPKAAPKAKATALSVADAAAKVRELLAEINQGTVTAPRIDALLGTFKKDLKKPDLEELLGKLDIAGKPKTKDQAIARIGQVLTSQLEMYVKAQAFERTG